MLNVMTNKSGDLQSKPVPRVSYGFFILVAVITLTLASAFIVLDARPTMRAFLSLDQRGGQSETAKQKILDWMAENSSMPDQVLTSVYNAAAVTGNRDLILAICLVESNFNPHVKSNRGAIGLMGIMPGVWLKELKKQGIIDEKNDLYTISGNIAAGAHVLATYLLETNDLRQALIRYVGGSSWYATRVLQAEKEIRLAQYPDRHLASAGGLN